MWCCVETICDILGGMEQDPLAAVALFNDKYSATDEMRRRFSDLISAVNYGLLFYAKYDDEKRMAKIVFEQTVVVLAVKECQIPETKKQEK